MNATNLKKSDYIFLVIVLIGFYLLYRFSIFTADDYSYSFIHTDINNEYIPINSFADAIKSNIYDYMHLNGRFIIHTITSYFCGVLGVDVFRITNSIVFVLLIVGLIKLVRNEFGYNPTDKYIILFLLFLFMPVPGHIFLGHIAIVTNYLWTACAIIYFILLYHKTNKNLKTHNVNINILLFVIGVIIGSLQESFTIGISGALFLYYCFHIKKLKGTIAWIVIGFWIGTCIVTLAPGNFERLSIVSSENRFTGLLKYMNQFAHLIFDTKLLLSYLLISIILYFKNKKFITNFSKKNKFYLIAILLNGIITVIVYTGERQLTCIELFSLILWIKLIYSFFFIFCENKRRTINVIISLTLILLYIPIYRDRQINYEGFKELQNTQPQNGVIIDKNIENYSGYIKNHRITYNHTLYILSAEYTTKWIVEGLSLIKSNGKNRNYISTILPTSVENIHAQFSNKSNFIYDKINNVYYIKCPKEKLINNIYIYSKPSKLFGKIRNTLFNIDYNKIEITDFITSFKYFDYIYYVFYNSYNIEIKDFEIEYK